MSGKITAKKIELTELLDWLGNNDLTIEFLKAKLLQGWIVLPRVNACL